MACVCSKGLGGAPGTSGRFEELINPSGNNDKHLRGQTPSQPAKLQLGRTSGQTLPLALLSRSNTNASVYHKIGTEAAGTHKKSRK